MSCNIVFQCHRHGQHISTSPFLACLYETVFSWDLFHPVNGTFISMNPCHLAWLFFCCKKYTLRPLVHNHCTGPWIYRLQATVSSGRLSCPASTLPMRLSSAPCGWCSNSLNHDSTFFGGVSSDFRMVPIICSSWVSNDSSALEEGMTIRNLQWRLQLILDIFVGCSGTHGKYSFSYIETRVWKFKIYVINLHFLIKITISWTRPLYIYYWGTQWPAHLSYVPHCLFYRLFWNQAAGSSWDSQNSSEDLKRTTLSTKTRCKVPVYRSHPIQFI